MAVAHSAGLVSQKLQTERRWALIAHHHSEVVASTYFLWKSAAESCSALTTSSVHVAVAVAVRPPSCCQLLAASMAQASSPSHRGTTTAHIPVRSRRRRARTARCASR